MLCMLACYVEWHMREALATLSRLRAKPRSESAAEFEMTSMPLQAEAFRLLGVRLS